MPELYRIRQCQKSWAVDEHGRIAGGTREQMLALVEQWNAHNLKLDILPDDLSYEVVLDPLDASRPNRNRVDAEELDRRIAAERRTSTDLRPYRESDRVWVSFPYDDTRLRGVVVHPNSYDESAAPGYTRVICENKGGRPIIVPNRRVSMRYEAEDFPKKDPAEVASDALVATLAVVWIVEQADPLAVSHYDNHWVQIGICRTETEALELRLRNGVGIESATHYNGRHRAADALVYGDRLVLVDVQKFETFEKAGAR